jgi:hypothetical protein
MSISMSLTRLSNLISSTEGRFLYVDPNEFNASDLISNRGNSPTRPFKTIQRALLEVARFSYVAGPDRGNDKYDQYSILLSPGDHWLDNRPGYFVDWDVSANYWNTDQNIGNTQVPIIPQLTDQSNFDIFDDNNDLFKFNSTDGGVIIPRGTSIVGSDLRKTRIRPRYVPDPMYAEYLDSNNPGYATSDYKVPGSYVEEGYTQTLGRAAFFRVTGACYFWQFSIFDAIPTNTGGIYRYATNDANDIIKFTKYTQNYEWNLTQQPLTTNATTGLGSHHKVTGFEYANGMSVADLTTTTVTAAADTEIFLNKINSGSQARLYMGDLLLIDNGVDADKEIVKVKKVYTDLSKIEVYRNQLGTTAPATHPANVSVIKLNDLGLYYAKIARGFSAQTIDDAITDSQGEIEARQQENRIVGPLNVDNKIASISISQIVNNKYKITITTRGSHGLFKNQIVSLKDLDVTETTQGTGFTGQINGTVFVGTVLNANTIEVQKDLSGSTIAQTYTFNQNAAATLVADIDTVDSASPYIFNCSIRSVFGICGMLTDGSKATGFKSMVVAQYTGVSLQKDDRAFIRYVYQNQNRTDDNNNPLLDPAFLKEGDVGYLLPSDQNTSTMSTLHSVGDAYYQDNWRTFHVRIINESLIQAVSVFAVGFCDHFVIEDGGDISITNSNSNFGNTALRAIGFREKSFPQDKYGKITHIVPPQSLDPDDIDQFSWYPFDVAKTQEANTTTSRTRLYLFNAVTPASTPQYVFDNKYVLGGKPDEKVFADMTIGALVSKKEASLATNTESSGLYEAVQEKAFTINPNNDVCTLANNDTHQWRTGTPVRLESETGYMPDGLEPDTIYYIITENGGRWISNNWSGDTGVISNRSAQFKLAKTLEEAKAGTALDLRTDNPPKTVNPVTGAITTNGEMKIFQKTFDVKPVPANFEFITSGSTDEFITVNDAEATGGNYTEIPHGLDRGQPIFFAKSKATDTMPSLSTGALDVTQFYYAYPTSKTRFKIVATQDDADNDRNLLTLGPIGASGAVKVYTNSGQWSVSPWITRNPLQYDPSRRNNAPINSETGTYGNWIVTTKSTSNEIVATLKEEADYSGNEAPKTTSPSYIERLKDVRQNYDRTYRFRYVLPKENRDARPPFLGYVLKLRTNSDGYVMETWDGGNSSDYTQYERTFYIYDIAEIQDYIPQVQDGVYYLTLLLADIEIDHDRMVRGDGGSITQNWFKKFKFSQNTAELYPALEGDNPQQNPVAAKSVADHKVHGFVYSNSRLKSITREAAEAFLDDNNYGQTEITNLCVSNEGDARRGREDQSRLKPIGYLRGGSTNRTEDEGIQIELRRPSLVRSGNHTFEYVGYGPGNYSTAFPAKQQRELTDREVVVSQAKKEDAGVVFYSGLNSQGDLFVGNQKINAVTGAIEIIDESILEISALPPEEQEEETTTGDRSPNFFDVTVRGTLTVENSNEDTNARLKGSNRGPTRFFGGVQYSTPREADGAAQKVTFYGAPNGFQPAASGDYRGIHDLFSTNSVNFRAVEIEQSAGNVQKVKTIASSGDFRKSVVLWGSTTRPGSYQSGAGETIDNLVSTNLTEIQATWSLGRSYGDIAHKPQASFSQSTNKHNTSWVFLPDTEGSNSGHWYQHGLTQTGGLYPYEDQNGGTTGRLGINGYYRTTSKAANLYVKGGSQRLTDALLGIDRVSSTNTGVLWIENDGGGTTDTATICFFQDAPTSRIGELGGVAPGTSNPSIYSFDVASGHTSRFGDDVVFSTDVYIEDDCFFRGTTSGISIPNTHGASISRTTDNDSYFFRIKNPGTANNVFKNFSSSNGFSSSAATLFSPEIRDDIMNNALPPGAIIMWNGTSSNIPNGYVLCNGSQYTDRNGNNITSPNMTDKFVKGVAAVGTTGGNHSISRTVEISGHELSRAEIPSHTHGMNANFFRHNHNLDGKDHTHGYESGNQQDGDGSGNGGGTNPVGKTTSGPNADWNPIVGAVRYAGGSDFPGDWLNGGGFLDLAGNKTCRTGPGSGGDDRGDVTAGRHVGEGTRDSRRPLTQSSSNTLGRGDGNTNAFHHHHPIRISGTGQSTSGAIELTNWSSGDSQNATMTWDNQPEWVGLVFIMKL